MAMFNTHKAYKALREAGCDPDIAEAVVDQIFAAIGEIDTSQQTVAQVESATKVLESKVESLRERLDLLSDNVATKEDIAKVRGALAKVGPKPNADRGRRPSFGSTRGPNRSRSGDQSGPRPHGAGNRRSD